MLKHYGIKVQDKYYKHEQSTVIENNAVTILWDMTVQTDKEIKTNRPNIVVKDKEKRTWPLIDISIPNKKSTSIKTVEKLSKCKDRETETEKTRKPKTTTVLVLIGALGLVKKGLETTSARSQQQTSE